MHKQAEGHQNQLHQLNSKLSIELTLAFLLPMYFLLKKKKKEEGKKIGEELRNRKAYSLPCVNGNGFIFKSHSNGLY